jgi:asparagine synthetase B (glutamine-hydrolysing)
MTDLLPIANVMLHGDEPVDPGCLDPTLPFTAYRGHFALHLERPGDEHLLVRDPLGVNKLFFAVTPEGRLDVANYFIDLRRLGHPAPRIWSVPSGHQVRISPSRRTYRLEKHAALPFAEDEPPAPEDLERYATTIRARLEGTFRALRPVLAGRPLYVTMSGGLDSTTVAVLTRELVGDFVGVTFRVEGPEGGRDDLHFARRVAESLGVPLEVVTVPRQALLDLVDPVLVYGQDFRDFNVHCGLVNAALAAALGRRHPPGGVRPVVLTGDTMNELVADYTPVEYGARQYYGLPALSMGKMRKVLVNGLDSGDREVGIFAHHGVDTIQPYALCPEVYTELPGPLLAEPGAKQRIARLVMGERVPSFIYDRPKVRAQVGSSEQVGGTLAALVDQGIDAAELERRFCALTGIEPRALRSWIRAGYYRFTPAYPEES